MQILHLIVSVAIGFLSVVCFQLQSSCLALLHCSANQWSLNQSQIHPVFWSNVFKQTCKCVMMVTCLYVHYYLCIWPMEFRRGSLNKVQVKTVVSCYSDNTGTRKKVLYYPDYQNIQYECIMLWLGC